MGSGTRYLGVGLVEAIWNCGTNTDIMFWISNFLVVVCEHTTFWIVHSGKPFGRGVNELGNSEFEGTLSIVHKM